MLFFYKALWKYLSFQDDLLEKSRYITRSCAKISVRVWFFFFISLCPLFTQSQLLSPEAHNLLLVAIAFSSTILLNPNPHIDLLCTLVINYPRVKTTETSRTEAGQGHFNESRLINIFIFFLRDLTPLWGFYIQSMHRVCVSSQRSSSKPCQLCGPTVTAALIICLLMTDVMQSGFYNSGRQNLWAAACVHLVSSLLLPILQPEVQTYASGTPVRAALICFIN